MASRVASLARILTMAACLMGAAPLFAQTPSNLRVDGLAANDHVTGSTPTFCWDFAGHQGNWQIQVDDDPVFEATARHAGASAASVWFWDSGSQPKGALGTQRCAVMRQVVKPGTVSMGLDRRIGAIHWRLRLQSGSGWGPWVSSTLRVDQPPLMPSALSVMADPREGTGPVAASPAAGGRVLHVSPRGDDAGAGDADHPFRTVARAVTVLSAGDMLMVHGGVYEENVRIDRQTPGPDGSRAPIVVKAAPGEAPVLRAASAGTRVALEIGSEAGSAGWVIDGLTFGGAATQTGVVIGGGARDVTLSNCRWEGSIAADATGVRVEAGSRDILISGCQFDQPLSRQVEIAGASHVVVRSNEFSGFGDGRALLVRGGATSLSIEGNIFRDAAPADAAVEIGGGATGTRIGRNLFARLGGGVRSAAVRVYRGGGLVVEHNDFHAVQGTALQINEAAPFGVYRNNIVSSCGRGLRFQGGASSVTGSVVDFNIFSANGKDLDWGGAGQALLDHAPAGNCLGGPGCDPQFRDAAAGDFGLRDTSPARDAADPFSPVPEGGGLRADIGLRESGAPAARPATPSLEPIFSVSDPTPRFTWSLDDVDDRLTPPAAAPSRQARFQLQLDSRPTFDGASGSPVIDSGVVAAAGEEYILPSAHALATGSYYVRVRQWDGHETVPGAWSDPVRFTVQGPGPVELASASPAAGDTVAPGDADRLQAELVSRQGCLDPSRVRLFLDGSEVSPALSGDAARLSLTYEAPGSLRPGSQVSVRVVAGCAGHSEAALDTAWTFVVSGPAPAPPTGLKVGR